ncbi:MAG: hypothetical protein E3J21_10960 [Anaerolineales bacterium]|nr:MAG: hypothetical protein E3J21_10960 [Anaerolineales bacterium]
MRVVYTDHLKLRLRARRIPERMPERIYREAQERYYNHATFRHVAVMSVIYHRRRRKMMIAYDEFPDRVEIVTIHPIESRQISERVLAGRWTHE